MGSEVNEDYLKALGGYGADRVYYIDSPLLKDYTTDAMPRFCVTSSWRKSRKYADWRYQPGP